MAKRVRICLELDEHFVRLLNAQAVGLKGLGPDLNRQHSPMEALAVVVLAEARGAWPEQVHLLTPPEWRPHLGAVPRLRRVLTEQGG